jgi:hypothetical protein
MVTQGRPSNPGHLYAAFAIQIFFVLLQAYLVMFHWETLCSIDAILKAFRTAMVSQFPVTDHRLPGWIIWSACTFFMLKSALRTGRFFSPVGRRPW